mmetsp:Transcript_56806/g.126854  ORF Transcript_56806/g.126854 Transcript_56806/m.126854 type:complete len:91 (+) Transcript_56806:343-615(+)
MSYSKSQPASWINDLMDDQEQPKNSISMKPAYSEPDDQNVFIITRHCDAGCLLSAGNMTVVGVLAPRTFDCVRVPDVVTSTQSEAPSGLL